MSHLRILSPKWGGKPGFSAVWHTGTSGKILMLLNSDCCGHLACAIPRAAHSVSSRVVGREPKPLIALTLTSPSAASLADAASPHRLKGSEQWAPGALSFLLLLLLVATGDADMKGHFDPGEETGCWVPDADVGWETELVALTFHTPVPTLAGRYALGMPGPDHPDGDISASSPWSDSTAVATAGTHTWGCPRGKPLGPLLVCFQPSDQVKRLLRGPLPMNHPPPLFQVFMGLNTGDRGRPRASIPRTLQALPGLKGDGDGAGALQAGVFPKGGGASPVCDLRRLHSCIGGHPGTARWGLGKSFPSYRT